MLGLTAARFLLQRKVEPSAAAVGRAKRAITQRIVSTELATSAQIIDSILAHREPHGLQHAVRCLHSFYAPQGAPRRGLDYLLDVADLAAD